ncbi:MAG: MBL fold metallo-hydrolase [Parachlamydiales bacterium]|nr:MBL fold metallo-hydrolase [Parachlamydiales bacterium]
MTKHLKFWGTRGSCPVSGPEYIHFGGNTPCLELQYDDQFLIFDAGTGIRPLGHSLCNEIMCSVRKIDLFLSHFHWDHILGFPFFEPIYRNGTEITIWAPKGNGRTGRDLFGQLLAKEFFPVHLNQIQAKLEFKIIESNVPVSMGPLTLDFCSTHHPGHTLCFKIKTPEETIGYVTDNEIDGDQEKLIEFHKGVDLFIHEAQYTPKEYAVKQGWGHSSLEKALDLIKKVRPGKWIVTHHDPSHTDADLRALEKIAKASPLPCPVEWIGDGHVIPLK